MHESINMCFAWHSRMCTSDVSYSAGCKRSAPSSKVPTADRTVQRTEDSRKSFSAAFRKTNRFERYAHTCVLAVTSTRKPCFAAGCTETRRYRLCAGQLCNISVILETRSTHLAHSDQSNCRPNPQDKRDSPILARSLAED